MTLQSCLQPGCPNLVESGSGGRCLEHASAHDAGQNRRGSQIYRTTRWRALRKRVIKEEPWCRCVYNCLWHRGTGGKCLELSNTVDHVKPLREGGAPFDRENLQGLCERCHSVKTQREVQTPEPGPRGG